MLQSSNTVLVSNIDLKTTYAGTEVIADLTNGEIFMETQDGKIVNEDGDLTGATAIRFGLKTSQTISYTDVSGASQTRPFVKYTPYIKKGSVRSFVINNYAAPTEEVIVADLSSSTVVAGMRYVVRVVYRDLYEHPGQFTKTYEIKARSTSVNDLLQDIKGRILKDTGRRIDVATTLADGTTSSTSAAVKLVLTAKAKNDNEGKESINIYTQVCMELGMWYTNPAATGFGSKIKEQIPSITITKTVKASPGKGYWKQVRDREQAALAYKGFAYRNVWPYSQMKPTLEAGGSDLSSPITYDSLVVEFENKYLTPDNQLNSTTKQAVELYFKTGSTRKIETWFSTFAA